MTSQQDLHAARGLFGRYAALLKVIDCLEAENKQIADDNRKIIQEMSSSCRLLGSNLPSSWTTMVTARERLCLLQNHTNELFYRHATFQAGEESLARLRRDYEALVMAQRLMVGKSAALKDDYRRLSQQPISWLSVSGFIVETLP